MHTRLGGFAYRGYAGKIRSQILRVIQGREGVRFIKDNKPETLSITRDYLHVSAEGYRQRSTTFSPRSLELRRLGRQSTVDSEIRLAREQLKISKKSAKTKSWIGAF